MKVAGGRKVGEAQRRPVRHPLDAARLPQRCGVAVMVLPAGVLQQVAACRWIVADLPDARGIQWMFRRKVALRPLRKSHEHLADETFAVDARSQTLARPYIGEDRQSVRADGCKVELQALQQRTRRSGQLKASVFFQAHKGRKRIPIQPEFVQDVTLARQHLLNRGGWVLFQEPEEHKIQPRQAFTRAEVVRVARQEDAFARRPGFDGIGPPPQRAPRGLLRDQNLGRAQIAENVARQGRPEVGLILDVEEPRQARPADGSLVKRLIGEGAIDEILGGRSINVRVQLKGEDRIGGCERGPIRPGHI